MVGQVFVLVPSQRREILVMEKGSAGRVFKEPSKALSFIARQKSATVLGIMGGHGQNLFARVLASGNPVYRIPIYRLIDAGLETGSSASDRALALIGLWEENPDLFYQMRNIDPTMLLIRELTRQRLNIQDFRKPATNQLHFALRDLEFILPQEARSLIELLRKGLKELFSQAATRQEIEEEFERLQEEVALTDVQQARIFSIRKFFSNPQFIRGAKEDEKELEARITSLLRGTEIFAWLNPKESRLPSIKGLGPSLGGSIISEILDIRRFPSPSDLRAYARFHVAEDGGFPRRKAGQISPWNRYLDRAVWLWSTDQVARYKHIWRELYLWKKAKEIQAHPEPVARESTTRNKKKTVYDFTLKHIDSRAKRWVGSQMLEYLWGLWWTIEKGENPEDWYQSSAWPVLFSRVAGELNAGLSSYLEQEIDKRKKREPEDVQNEEQEEDF